MEDIKNNRFGILLLVLYFVTYILMFESYPIVKFFENSIYDSDTIVISQQIKGNLYLCHTILLIIFCIGLVSISKAYILTKLGYFSLLLIWLLFLLFLMSIGAGMMS